MFPAWVKQTHAEVNKTKISEKSSNAAHIIRAQCLIQNIFLGTNPFVVYRAVLLSTTTAASPLSPALPHTTIAFISPHS